MDFYRQKVGHFVTEQQTLRTMDWSHIERDVAIRTDSMTNRRFDFANIGGGSERPRKITKLLDGILSSRLMIDEKPSREFKSSFDENVNQNHPLFKSILGDLGELQSLLRVQANKLDMFEGSCMKFDHEAVHLKKNQETLFNRVDHIESGLQGKSSDVDVVDLYHDMQLRLKRVESNLEGLEENSRMFQVQFATKDAFSKLLDTIFDQLKTLSSTVELSKEQCNHASILFDALANAFVLLNGDDNRHQLELVTSFSRDINKEHLSKILTDALMRSVDGSIQAHLKPAMGLMHSSILELINEMRDRQDSFSQSMRSNFGQLSRQFQDEKVNLADYVPRHMMVPAPPAEPKMDPAFLAEFAQMKEQMDALAADNKSLRESLEEQSSLLSDLTASHENTKTLDAEQLLKLKTHCETLEHDLFALKQDFSAVQVDCRGVQLAVKDVTVMQEIADKKVAALESSLTEKLQSVQISIKDNYVDFSTKLNTKADLLNFTREAEDLQGQCKQHATALRSLQNDFNTRASKIDLDTAQSKFDVVSSELNILQGDVSTLDKKLQSRLKGHDDDLDELRRLSAENADGLNKCSKRVDLTEATLQSKVSNLGTELHHKVADSVESVGRLARRVDALDTDVQSSSVSLRETQVKLQTQADGVADLNRRVNLLDTSCSSQMQSLSSTQKNHADETTDALAKLVRKLDLSTAELQSKFTIRNDRVDSQLAQNQESMSKLVDRLELSEHKQLAQLEELSTELRSKISGALDFSAQLNRRFETHQSETHTKFNTLQIDLTALGKALNDRINQVIKQTDANIELTTSQLNSKHAEVAHKVQNLGDSLAHLAQQQYDLCSLQEKQQNDLGQLGTELNTTRTKLEEKVASSVATMQSNLTIHTKSHQAALSEAKYDLLQLTSRVALVEQLIRYGQDIEDYNATTFGSADSTGNSEKSIPNVANIRTLTPRPADPEVRQRLKELKQEVDAVREDASSARTEFDSRLDAFKAALAALRTQYEDDVEEIKESAESEQLKNARTEQAVKSLQAQIDVLQEEVQEMGQNFEERSPIRQADKSLVKISKTVSLPENSPAPVPASNVRTAPQMSVANTTSTHTTDFGSTSGHISKAPAADAPAAAVTTIAAPVTGIATNLKTSEPSKSHAPHSPEKPNLAALRAALSAPAPANTRTPPRPSSRTAADDSFDTESSFEGSDVFPQSPASPTPWDKNKNNESVDGGVLAFSPGSVASPPAKAKLSIQTFGPGSSVLQSAVPDTPDSPWDVDSEDDSPARRPFGASASSGTSSKSQKEDADVDDSSSVDSEVRAKKATTSVAANYLAATAASTAPSSVSSASKPNPINIQGPSIASITQFGGAGTSASKSPGRPLLSGSLKPRSSGPSFGSLK